MSAPPVFDIDAIMRDVRAAANRRPPATPATLLQTRPDRSDVAIVATDEAAEIEERAALAADRVPAAYLDAWARLNHQEPANVNESRWRLALDDGGRFLDAWGDEAAELGWTAFDLFEVLFGLVWRLVGERVEALGPDHAELSDRRIIRRGWM